MKPTDTDLLRMILKEDISFNEFGGDYKYCGFCCKTQHVYGNSKREILHKMYVHIQKYADKCELHRESPTLEEMVRDKTIPLKETNWFACDKTGMSAHGYSKEDVEYAREHGIEAYDKKRSIEIADSWIAMFGKDAIRESLKRHVGYPK